MKLRDKNISGKEYGDIEDMVTKYTVGNDYLLDMKLIPYDIKGSKAHANMLERIGIITKKENTKLQNGLEEISELYKQKKFIITIDQEDVHTAIEEWLTDKLGDIGKKIHTGRSRNDQILTALRLYMKENIIKIETLIEKLIDSFNNQIKENGNIPMPGYTHMQKAMSSNVGMWLGSFHDSLKDDMLCIQTTKKIINQNPLGSAAGFGESVLGINRYITTKELGFNKIQKNPMYCAYSRGKFELLTLQSCYSSYMTISKFASDLMIFTTKEFNFFDIDNKFKTGSSIMPQKKNRDILELIRGNSNILSGYIQQIQNTVNNLLSGYNRDFQLTKKPFLEGIELIESSLIIVTEVLDNLKVNKENLENACTEELYATYEAYKLVKKGVPFRDAYKEIGKKYNE